MLQFSGSNRPWLARLDHIICETSDIEAGYEALLRAGFPSAWPIGRFWPQGQTAGVHLGKVNLELLQPDEGAPEVATIQTLAFEPIDLDGAVAKYESLGLKMIVAEKWESDPDLLRLRGFSEEECRSPQLICRNAYSEEETPFSFFLCEYSAGLKARLTRPVDIAPVADIVLSSPDPWQDWSIARYWGLPIESRGVELMISENPGPRREVTQIVSDRGPIDLDGFKATFRFA